MPEQMLVVSSKHDLAFSRHDRNVFKRLPIKELAKRVARDAPRDGWVPSSGLTFEVYRSTAPLNWGGGFLQAGNEVSNKSIRTAMYGIQRCLQTLVSSCEVSMIP